MTILWIYNELFHPEAGGTQRITSLTMKGLEQAGHHCLGLLVFDKQTLEMSINNRPILDLYHYLKKNHVEVVINQVAYETELLHAFLQKGGQQWKEEGGRVISCLHFDPKKPSLQFLFKCIPNKTLHDWLTLVKLTVLQPYYNHQQDKQTGAIYKEIYEKSDWFVALSKTHFPYLKKVMELDNYDKLVAINNPLTFKDIADESIFEEKKNVCLIVARMSEYHKRISLALKAWRKVQQHPEAQDWTLKIVGDGPNLHDYKDIVKKYDVRNVEFLGQQSPEPYYREAKIFLMTSSAEGWGLTLTESFQRGVVPVAMDSSPVFHEIIEEGQNGFITKNGDVNAFAKKMLLLISQPAQWKAMAWKALKSANRFSMKRYIEKWTTLFIDH